MPAITNFEGLVKVKIKDATGDFALRVRSDGYCVCDAVSAGTVFDYKDGKLRMTGADQWLGIGGWKNEVEDWVVRVDQEVSAATWTLHNGYLGRNGATETKDQLSVESSQSRTPGLITIGTFGDRVVHEVEFELELQ